LQQNEGEQDSCGDATRLNSSYCKAAVFSVKVSKERLN